MSEGTLVSGERVGEWKEWYDNGQLKMEINYENGLNTFWTRTGTKEMDGVMVNGKRDKSWTN